MDFFKIIEIATKCEIKRNQINEHYRMMGANPQFEDDVRNAFIHAIKDMDCELDTLQNKLKKHIKQ